jgi:hypothetical protein
MYSIFLVYNSFGIYFKTHLNEKKRGYLGVCSIWHDFYELDIVATKINVALKFLDFSMKI